MAEKEGEKKTENLWSGSEWVDSTDIKILSMLQADGRLTYKKIARALGIAIGTVHNRIMRMKREGVIKKFAPVIDPLKLGYKVSALIEVKMKPGFYDLGKKLEAHSNVFGCWTLTGEADAMILGRFRDTEEMSNFIKQLVTEHPHIEKTLTHVILTSSKEDFSPNLGAALHPLLEKKK